MCINSHIVVESQSQVKGRADVGDVLFKSKIYSVLLIAAAVILILKGISSGEPYYSGDEARHLMTGVFFRDLIVDFPASNPIEYTYKYYAKYPALGLIHWPPLFHAVEGLFFLFLGVSEVSARLSVAAFAVLLLIFWYRLVSRVYDDEAALFSGLLLIGAPAFIKASTAVMLEIPSLALSVASIYFFYSYVRSARSADVYYLGITLAAALLTKQTTIFLIPFFALYLLLSRRLDIAKRTEVWLALSIASVPVFLYYYVALKLHGSVMLADILRGTWAENHLFKPENYTLYLKFIPDQVGIPATFLSILFVAAILILKEHREHLLFLVWPISCYLTFTLIAQKDPRYTVYWIAPLSLFPVLLISRLKPQARLGPISLSTLILLGVSGTQLARAFVKERPFVSGYEEAAGYVASALSERNTVLFDGYLDGNFIFFVRKHDPGKKLIVLRSDKMLFSVNILPEYGLHIYRSDRESIRDLIESHGTKYVVVEGRDLAGYQRELAPRKVLRELLSYHDFKLVKAVEVKSNLRNYRNLSLLIYENVNSGPLKYKELSIPMPSLGGRVLRVNLP